MLLPVWNLIGLKPNKTLVQLFFYLAIARVIMHIGRNFIFYFEILEGARLEQAINMRINNHCLAPFLSSFVKSGSIFHDAPRLK